MSKDLENCDFWFKLPNIVSQPSIISAHKNGGMIEIREKEIKSSILYEKFIAPENGYRSELTLSKETIGFFLKCKDGKSFAKIFFEKSEIDVNIPDGEGGRYSEYGKAFNCLYQPNGTHDLSFPLKQINLENFLVDIRMK